MATEETSLGEDPATVAAKGDEAPAAERGGCMNLGWGCLPVVLAATLILPGSLLL